MKYHYTLVCSFLAVSLLVPVSVWAADSCDIIPTGTYIEAEDYTVRNRISDEPGENFEVSDTKVQISEGRRSKVLVAGSLGTHGTFPEYEIVEYNVNFTEPGDYYIWFNAKSESGSEDNENSIYFQFPGSDVWKVATWDADGKYGWETEIQGDENLRKNHVSADVVSAGIGTIKIGMREKNARIDGFYITKDSDDDLEPTFSPKAVPGACVMDLTPDDPNDSTCSNDEIPLYARNMYAPAIMVHLDLSGSMSRPMYNDNRFFSSDLSYIVQEMIDDAGWDGAGDLGFYVEGRENPLFDKTRKNKNEKYNGNHRFAIAASATNSEDAPTLEVTYSTSKGSSTIETVSRKIDVASDNFDIKGSSRFDAEKDTLHFRPGAYTRLIFKNIDIPKDAYIRSAQIQLKWSGKSFPNQGAVGDYEVRGLKKYNNISSLSSSEELKKDKTINFGTLNYIRIDYAVAVLREVFEDTGIAWGLATWHSKQDRYNDDAPDYDGYTELTNYTQFIVGARNHDDEGAHLGNLRNGLNGIFVKGHTPLTPTLGSAVDYFGGGRADKAYNEKYEDIACQPKIAVIVTDGEGTTGTSDGNWKTATTNLTKAGVSVVAVGFGLTNAPQLDDIASIAQVAGDLSSDDSLYGLHDKKNGEVVPFLASSPEEFSQAMGKIVSSVKVQQYHGAAPAPTTSSDNGDILVTATFDPRGWSGDLIAYKYKETTDENGETTGSVLPDGYLWKASKVYQSNPVKSDNCSYDDGGNIVSYTDDICKNLGDIINSAPIIIGRPSYFYDFNDYNTFKYNDSVLGRDTIIYVNSNDGALHAFLAGHGASRSDDDTTALGTELWRFYPPKVISTLAEMYDGITDMCEDGCHRYINDGSPTVGDIYTGDAWKTVLVSGLGRGGAGVFAMDITYGGDPLDGGDKRSQYLWEFTDTDDPELGYATSNIELSRVRIVNDDSSHWLAFFGSGKALDDDAQENKGAYIFAVNAWDKSAPWEENGAPSYKTKIGTKNPATEDEGDLLANDIPSSPLVVDYNDNAKSDRIYVGNRYGDLIRIQNIGYQETPTTTTLFSRSNKPELSKHPAPITAKPGYAYGEGDDLWVYFGSGKFEEQSDKETTNQQYMYGIKDRGASSNTTLTVADLRVCSVNSNITSDGTELRTMGDCNNGDASNGWAFKLSTLSNGRGSERVVSEPLIVGGVAFFTTFIPDDDPCAGSGDAYLFALDYKTGDDVSYKVFPNVDPQNIDGKPVVGIYLGKGVPYKPVIQGDTLFVGTSDAQPVGVKVNLPEHGIKVKAWRQNFGNE